jgi:apolipoprotein N-acyltransferase
MNSSRRAPIAALLLGALSVLGFAPFEIFPLPILSLSGLFLLWQQADSPRRAAALGWLWGIGCFLSGVSWVYISLHDMGGMLAPLALAATLALCALLALYPALAGALYAHYACRRPWPDALLVAGLWMLSEWLRGWMLTGFPWLASGYAQTPPSPLSGYAAVLGVYGIGLLAAFLAGLLAFLRPPHVSRRDAGQALTVLLLILGIGALLGRMDWTQPSGKPITVSLLQGNISQETKWDADRVPFSLITYARLLHEHPAQLVVMPETALPMFLDEVPREYLSLLMKNGPVLTGVATYTREPGKPDGYANVALAIDREGRLQTYAKSHLVPFGEYVPSGFSWFMGLMNMPMSDFTPGPPDQPPMEIAGQKIAPNICFEDLFGEAIIRSLPQATLLINISNTAWFGDSLAQPQHLQIARLRALESGRTLLRATNTGMTAAIAPDGRVIATLPPFTRAGMTLEVQGYRGTTPYVRWGNGLALACALAALLPTLQQRRRKRNARA